MRNNLLVTILFLASSSIILSQDLRIKNLQIESKNNGTVIQLDSNKKVNLCLLYTSPSPRDKRQSRMPSSA